MRSSFLFAAIAVAHLGAGTAYARDQAPGEGVLCSEAMISVMAEVGNRCFPGQDAAAQAALRHYQEQLDQFILKDPDWSKAKLAAFKRQQAGVGAKAEAKQFCSGDATRMYQSFVHADQQEFRVSMDTLVARPGKPTWGDCL